MHKIMILILVSGAILYGQNASAKDTNIANKVSASEVSRHLLKTFRTPDTDTDKNDRLTTTLLVIYEGFQERFYVTSISGEGDQITTNSKGSGSTFKWNSVAYSKSISSPLSNARTIFAFGNELKKTSNNLILSYEGSIVSLRDNSSIFNSSDWALNKVLMPKEIHPYSVSEAITLLEKNYGLQADILDGVVKRLGDKVIWVDKKGHSVRDLIYEILLLAKRNGMGRAFQIRPIYSGDNLQLHIVHPEEVKTISGWLVLTLL